MFAQNTEALHSALARSSSDKMRLAMLAEDIPGLPDPGRGPELGIGCGIGKKGAGPQRGEETASFGCTETSGSSSSELGVTFTLGSECRIAEAFR